MHLNISRFLIAILFILLEIFFIKISYQYAICVFYVSITFLTLYNFQLISVGFLFFISIFFDIFTFRFFGLTFLQLIFIHIAVFKFRNAIIDDFSRKARTLLLIFSLAEFIEIIFALFYSVDFSIHISRIFVSLILCAGITSAHSEEKNFYATKR